MCNFATMYKEAPLDIKTQLRNHALAQLTDTLNDILKQLGELREASDGEEKNPAGDKYESGRESIHQSQTLLDKQYASLTQMQRQLKEVPVQPVATVQDGALLKLPIGNIWVSVPVGKVEFGGDVYQLVSKDSPLVEALWGMKAGESVDFRGRKVTLQEVI
jgi:hypothetical protein